MRNEEVVYHLLIQQQDCFVSHSPCYWKSLCYLYTLVEKCDKKRSQRVGALARFYFERQMLIIRFYQQTNDQLTKEHMEETQSFLQHSQKYSMLYNVVYMGNAKFSLQCIATYDIVTNINHDNAWYVAVQYWTNFYSQFLTGDNCLQENNGWGMVVYRQEIC